MTLKPAFPTAFVGGGQTGCLSSLTHGRCFDESHEILQLIDVARPDERTIQARTRLRFFLRRHQPGAARSEEFTGQAWHTWRLRRGSSDGQWRVAAQIVDGFAQLNQNAATLFGAPTEGLRT
jgi:hypothetical protein